jgi:hypothetical protein
MFTTSKRSTIYALRNYLVVCGFGKPFTPIKEFQVLVTIVNWLRHHVTKKSGKPERSAIGGLRKKMFSDL